jgi:hypothetical protein
LAFPVWNSSLGGDALGLQVSQAGDHVGRAGGAVSDTLDDRKNQSIDQ